MLLSEWVPHLRPGLLLEYEAILQEAICLFGSFSSRCGQAQPGSRPIR